MSEKEQAENLLYQAFETQAGPEVALHLAAQAQAYATLELAKQQRIANLIQIEKGRRKQHYQALRGKVNLFLTNQELAARTRTVATMIREGLGLKD